MRHLGTEQLSKLFGRCLRIFQRVMKKSGREADRPKPELGEQTGDLKGMGKIRFPRQSHLPVVNTGRIDIGPLNQIQIRPGNVGTETI
jgi:hypothetical protein